MIKLLIQSITISLIGSNSISRNVELETERILGNHSINDALLFFAGSEHNEGEYVPPLQINFQFSHMIVPDKEKYEEWGLMCEDPGINTCQIVNKEEIKEGDFQGVKYKYRVANTQMRLMSQIKIDPHQNLPLRLSNDLGKWEMGNEGILGLHPKGDFIQYLLTTFDQQSVSFRLELVKESDKEKLQVIINPSDGSLFVKDNLKLSQDKFISDIKIKEEIIGHGQSCLGLTQNTLINVLEPEKICNIFKKLVCKDTSKCSKAEAQLSQGANLQYKINSSVQFTFQPTEYFYFDSQDHLQCHFGQFDRQKEYCPETTEISLGKKFLQKFPIKIELFKNQDTELTILTNEIADSNIYLYFMVIPLLIAICIIIYLLFIKKKEAKDFELYIGIQNQEIKESNSNQIK